MEALKKIWNKPWKATSLPYRLRNWLLETATRVIEFVSGMAMLGYAAVFAKNGEKLVTTELYYKFAAVPLWAAAAVAEHFLPPEKAWLCCAAGIGAGLITGYVLDSVRALAPSTVQRVLEKLAGKAADKAE